ncbi:NAD dependent epimerase/dehydratase [Mariannaea sp. PMI_226]|nr:NAD dependent epimerase/dehydratase [Mariannaea sp. PMI_226]
MEFVKEAVYALQPPCRIRTVPLRVLAVGPSRSGTASLQAALLQLGYQHTYHGFDPTLHPEDDIVWHRLRLKQECGRRTGQHCLTATDFDQVIGHCAAITDHAAAAFAPELITAYPEAKVILNIRKDINAWHNSVMKTLVPLQTSWTFWFRSWFCSELFWLQEGFFRGNWQTFYRGSFEKHSRRVLEDHCHLVRSLVPPDRLLEWDVTDGWEPLCEFLKQPVPRTPFPTLNKDLPYEQMFQDRIARADANIKSFVLVIFLSGLFLWFVIY